MRPDDSGHSAATLIAARVVVIVVVCIRIQFSSRFPSSSLLVVKTSPLYRPWTVEGRHAVTYGVVTQQ